MTSIPSAPRAGAGTMAFPVSTMPAPPPAPDGGHARALPEKADVRRRRHCPGRFSRARLAALPAALGRAWTERCQRTAAALAAAAACAVPATDARAESLSTLGAKLQTMFTDLAKPLQIGFAFGGFFLVGVGLWQLYQRSQRPGEPKGGALIAIFVGGALIGASVIAKSTATSLTGSEGVASSLGL